MSNMVVRTNVLSLNSHRNLGMTGNAQARASARLSSGFRINSAADDAAGLGISETMRAQIRGLDQASRNAQDGISLIQTAEGALSTINDMVIRIRELTVQSGNDTNTDLDRSRIQDEVNQLIEEINDVSERTEFNTMPLLGGGTVDILANLLLDAITAGDVTGDEEAQQFIDFLDGINRLNDITEWGLTTPPTNENLIIAVVEALQTIQSAAIGPAGAGNVTVGDMQALVEAIEAAGGTAAFTVGDLTITTGEDAQNFLDLVNDVLEFGRQLEHGAVEYNEFTFQIGANSSQQITVAIDSMDWNSISTALVIDLVTARSEVADLLDGLDLTLNAVTAQRSELGAVQNRLEFTIENLDIASENLSAANSRIRDADMAREMMALTQMNVLQQAATAMLAQANQAPQMILQLLG